jgi:SAM-dependent methyltransferase
MSKHAGRPDPVPASAYSASTVVRFAGPDYQDFVATAGERLRPRLAHSLKLAALEPGMRVLDLGCGRGETAVHAALRGARVVALDYSADCLQLTRQAAGLVGQAATCAGYGGPAARSGHHAGGGRQAPSLSSGPLPDAAGQPAGALPDASAGQPAGALPDASAGQPAGALPDASAGQPAGAALDVQLALADATGLPFRDGSFERVLMLDVVEHLYPWQLEQTFREVRRVLAPDGYAVIHTLPNRWALELGYPLLRLVRPSLPRDPRTDYEREVHINEQDIVGLKRMLTGAGLQAKVWLENLTIEQARWQPHSDEFPDVRGPAYRFFRSRPARGLARLALCTPLRLIACNDIYAIARPD